MDYRVVHAEGEACMIEYKGKLYFVQYDYHSGRFECYDDSAEYIFPDLPDGGMLRKASKYETLYETYNSQEFMQAFTTEMRYWGELKESKKEIYKKLILTWGKE